MRAAFYPGGMGPYFSIPSPWEELIWYNNSDIEITNEVEL